MLHFLILVFYLTIISIQSHCVCILQSGYQSLKQWSELRSVVAKAGWHFRVDHSEVSLRWGDDRSLFRTLLKPPMIQSSITWVYCWSVRPLCCHLVALCFNQCTWGVWIDDLSAAGAAGVINEIHSFYGHISACWTWLLGYNFSLVPETNT